MTVEEIRVPKHTACRPVRPWQATGDANRLGERWDGNRNLLQVVDMWLPEMQALPQP